jgi:hypothetical protein
VHAQEQVVCEVEEEDGLDDMAALLEGERFTPQGMSNVINGFARWVGGC